MTSNAARLLDERLPRLLSSQPRLFQFGSRLGVVVATPAGPFARTIDLATDPPCVRSGVPPTSDAPLDATVSLDDDALGEIAADPTAARGLFHDGRLSVIGSLEAARSLPHVIALAAAERLPAGLGALLSQGSVDAAEALARFLAERWPDRFFVAQGDRARLDVVASHPALASVDALLDAWVGSVRLADRHGGRLVTPSAARDLYRAGHHLAFSHVECVVPSLRAWLTRLRWELSLPVSASGRCLAYASPDGVGEGAHFDQNANFVLQLRGEKDWRLAINRHVARPTQRYGVGFSSVPPALAPQVCGALPTAMPEDAWTERLRPGTVLVLPRGLWHETRAVGESLSLNFTFDQPCWADVVDPEGTSGLRRSPRWRELATGAGSPCLAAAAAARARLSALVATLPDDGRRPDVDASLARLVPVEAAPPSLEDSYDREGKPA